MGKTDSRVVIFSNEPPSTKVLVCGTGAMGSLFAGLLFDAGFDVTVLGTWDAALAKISTEGINILRDDESIIMTGPLRALSELEEGSAFDIVIILVKTFQTANLLPRLSGLFPDAPIITLQNGFGNREAISTGMPNPVWAGVTNIGATLMAAGTACWVGDGGTTLPDEPIFRRLFDFVWRNPIKTEFVANTRQAVWEKLVINASINPITAIYSVQNGFLLQSGEARNRMLAIATECAEIGFRRGMGTTLEMILDTLDRVLKATALNKSSMLSDVTRGSRTEIDSINGAVAQLGKIAGVPTPENERALAEVKALVR